MRRAKWKNISDLIERALARPEMVKTLHAQRVMKQWTSCVGEPISQKSRPERFQKGTLWVGVTSSAWVQELQMHKPEILKRLNELAEENLFTDIRFAVKPMSSSETDHSPHKKEFTPEEISIVVTNPELVGIARQALGRMKAAAKVTKGHPSRVDKT
jgi:hypothetical protein